MPRKRRENRNRVRKPRSQRNTRPGASPGTVQTSPDALDPVIRVMAYGNGQVVEQELRAPDQLAAFLKKYPVTWINVDGLGDAQTIRRLGGIFGIHPLAQEDVVNVHQRAKREAYEDHLFIVARMVNPEPLLESEQISLFLGKNYVLTFQERPGDCLEPVRRRIREGVGRLPQAGADYLAYALLDAVIDAYFPVVDDFADRLESLEDSVAAQRDPQIIDHIHQIRNELLLLRRAIRPHRDLMNDLVRDEHPLIARETRVFLRDCYDHSVQLIELLEVYRDSCAGLRDYHLSLVSNRMNEIMKVLTIIATIFIPLGFIAGVYGMNFDTDSPWNQPELHWRYGYLFCLGLMVAVVLGLLLYFRRKGWIGAWLDSDDSQS